MNVGRLFVISAPSGAGKTTLLRRVMARIPRLVFSVSHTTRAPREGEKTGVDYHFVSRGTFERMITDGLFLEHAAVHNNLYGTSRKTVEEQLAEGVDVILDIDVQGAAIIRRMVSVKAAYIFIAPPSMAELERRLRGRGTEQEDLVALRLKNAKAELQAAREYDYLLINDNLDEAEVVLSAIIVAERAKAHRRISGEPIDERVIP